MQYSEHYDYIFIGLGASSCILIHELHRKDMLSDKKVLILDPSEKLENDKSLQNRNVAFLIDEAHRSQDGKMALTMRKFFNDDEALFVVLKSS